MALSFAFDPQKGETPATIKEKRDLVRALMGASRAPQNVGEGLNALGDGIVAAVLDKRASAAEAAGMESWNNDWAGIAAALGGGDFPEAPSMSAPSSGGQANPVDMSGNDVFSGFMDTVKTGVTNPYALAAIAATGKHESAFDPKNAVRTWSDPSQSGQPGTAGGIMSWRGPRYQALAKTGDLSPQGQAKYFLQEDPKLIAALNNAKSVEEAQSLMNNAWRFAGYDRQGGEAARRLATARSLLPTFQGVAAPAAVAANEAMAAGQPVQSAPQPAGPLPLLDDMFDARAGGPPTLPMDANGAPIVTQPVPVAANEDDILALEAQMAQQDPQAFQMPQQMMQQPIDRMTPQQGQAIAAASVPQPAPDLSGVNPQAMFQTTPEMASTPNPGIVAALTQGGAQAPIQMAQADIPVMAGGDAPPIASPNIQQILRAAQNPFAPPAAQGIVKLLMEQEMQKRDPRYNLELENLRGQMDDRQIDNRREDARFGFEQDKFKTEAELAREKFEWEKGKPTDDIREYEFYEKRAREAGQQPLGPLEWDIMRRKAAAPSMSQTMGGPDDSELRKKLDGKTGELWSTFEEQGANSAAMVQDMQVLDELIKVAPQGPLQGRLAEAFPGFSSAGDAFQSIVKRVAPTLRAPGSGSTSDIEYDGMLRSLPALRNRPEANALIAEIMKAKAAINIERADIVARFAQDDISVKEARRQMGELNKRSIMSPEMKQLIEGVGGGQASDVPLPGDIVDEYRFLGGNPGDPAAWEKVE